MSDILLCLKNIFNLAFAIVPGSWFLLLLPFVVFVALVKFIRSM